MKFPAYPRSAKACETLVVGPCFTVQAPAGGTSGGASSSDDYGYRDADFAVAGSVGPLPSIEPAVEASPAGDREEPALTTVYHEKPLSIGDGRVWSDLHGKQIVTVAEQGLSVLPSCPLKQVETNPESMAKGSERHRLRSAEVDSGQRQARKQSDETAGRDRHLTAEVASHAGLSPMLLAEAMRDVMQRRVSR